MPGPPFGPSPLITTTFPWDVKHTKVRYCNPTRNCHCTRHKKLENEPMNIIIPTNIMDEPQTAIMVLRMLIMPHTELRKQMQSQAQTIGESWGTQDGLEVQFLE